MHVPEGKRRDGRGLGHRYLKRTCDVGLHDSSGCESQLLVRL